MSATLKDLKTQFLEYLEIEKGRSVKTVENYDRYLTRFLNFAKVVNPGDVTEASSVLPSIVRAGFRAR
jgi:site-specific recombinase XerC